jgi:hypothetical protein
MFDGGSSGRLHTAPCTLPPRRASGRVGVAPAQKAAWLASSLHMLPACALTTMSWSWHWSMVPSAARSRCTPGLLIRAASYWRDRFRPDACWTACLPFIVERRAPQKHITTTRRASWCVVDGRLRRHATLLLARAAAPPIAPARSGRRSQGSGPRSQGRASQRVRRLPDT